MIVRVSLALLLLSGCTGQATARILPSFSLNESAWKATHIVVVSEGELIDGHVQVLETWKGDLKTGEEISVPELSEFASEEKREISARFGFPGTKVENRPTHVTGARMVLFLKQSKAESEKWQPANLYNDMKVAAVWIENGAVYGFVQVMNPGPSRLIQLQFSERELTTNTGKILETQAELIKASNLDDLSERAAAIRPLTNSDYYYARQKAFAELSQCGTAALPVLRSMLEDQFLLSQHDEVIEALGTAGGAAVGPELTRLVESETKFWQQTAPELEVGWWNDTDLEDRSQLQDRYSKLLSALYALKKLKYRDCRNAVIQLRNYWRSLPQLEDKSGLVQMSQECDNVLSALAQ